MKIFYTYQQSLAFYPQFYPQEVSLFFHISFPPFPPSVFFAISFFYSLFPILFYYNYYLENRKELLYC